MEENEHPVWAELRDMQAHERREFEARARGEPSSFSRLNPLGDTPPSVESSFRFPWGTGEGDGRNKVQGDGLNDHAGALDTLRESGQREGENNRVGREWPMRIEPRPGVSGGAAAPALSRGLASPPRRGLVFSRFHGGGERGGAGVGIDEMGPEEFGLLMGEEGEDIGEGGMSKPLLADDWGAVENLDVFFTNMYKYYHSRGLLSIVSRGVAHLLILAFTVLFSTFLLSFVDWNALLSCRDEESCHPLSTYVTARALRKPNFFHVLVWMYMFLFLLYWLWSLLSFWASLRDAIDMHHLYTSRLKISPVDLHTIEWSEVVRRFLALQNTGRYRVAIYTSDVTAHDIASRIMRKENYLIAMLNKDILKLSLPLPFFGSRGSGSMHATTGQQYFTKSLEWSVHFCVLNHMFNEKFTVRREFLVDVRALRVRLVLVGLAHVLLLPFLLLFMLVYFFLQNAQEWHSSKSYLGPREWSPLARWTFREFNELPHFFEQRMSGSYGHANTFLLRFPRPVLTSVMRVTRFFSGAVVAVLLVLTVLQDTILLHVKFWDRNLFWYIGVFSATFAFSRSVASQASEGSVPQGESIEELMLKVAAHTHFMPEHWWGRTHTVEVRRELLGLFKYKAQLFLEELLSVLFAPVILCFSMPGCAQEIVDFVTEHTMDVPGVGSVCSYSLFDFGRYGDEDYAAPCAAAASTAAEGRREERRRRRPDTTEQGKMEKSFLNFRANYPDWKPGAGGQEMIDRLAGFQLQCLRKDAETVAANTAAAVAAAAAATVAATGGPGPGVGVGAGGAAGSHWGHGLTGVSPGVSRPGGSAEQGETIGDSSMREGLVSRNRDVGGGIGVGGSVSPVVPVPGSIRSTSTNSFEGVSMDERGRDAGARAQGGDVGGGRGGAGDGDGGGGGVGGDGGAGGAFDVGDDERHNNPSPLFPLFSPPRGGPGAGGMEGGAFGIGTAGAAGGRLSPSMGIPPSTLQSTLQLGLLNSMSPSLSLGLGTGAGGWLGGTGGGFGGGGVGGTATAGLGMSAAAPSFVQASQLAPLILSQMGPPSSLGGTPQLGRGVQGGAPPLGQGQENNFYWLEKFYAAHRSSVDLSSASEDSGARTFATAAATAAGTPAAGAGRLGGTGAGSTFASRFPGSRYGTMTRARSAGVGGGGAGVGVSGVGGAPPSSRGHALNTHKRGGSRGGGGISARGGSRAGAGGAGEGTEGEGIRDDSFAMEMTSQQQGPASVGPSVDSGDAP